ncbi:AbiJ-NTD4 domain-containing protein [Cupriavidus sp. H39]|uniref:AbiJ-NTD4 domain-containing protein n=1 Tax=Cupriavidus sp. H39 TaxID=3401635 RepID=UPI003CFC25C0
MASRFSDRIGVTQPLTILQLDGMGTSLRTSLWNVLHNHFEHKTEDRWRSLARIVAQYFRKTPIDDVPILDRQCREWMKSYFNALQWHEVYNLIEFIAENFRAAQGAYGADSRRFVVSINSALESECSGYRFVGGVLCPVTSSDELSSIDEAIRCTAASRLQGAQAHIKTALSLLSKKPEPDFRNSIKESISAVESVAKVLGKDDAQGLSGALNELAKKAPIHGALKSAFVSLYGYTSDEKGIRHAHLTEDSSVGFDEAKYMAVACSAFVNYLISKANKAGLL